MVTPLQVLPHRPPMLLLDRIVAHDNEALVAEIDIRETTLFFEAEGVPSYVGLEYMAQACGAFAGAESQRASEPVRIGYLLGTRDFEAVVPAFRSGDRLRVTARVLFRDGGMGSFECEIEIAGRRVASARLAVYQTETDPRRD